MKGGTRYASSPPLGREMLAALSRVANRRGWREKSGRAHAHPTRKVPLSTQDFRYTAQNLNFFFSPSRLLFEALARSTTSKNLEEDQKGP